MITKDEKNNFINTFLKCVSDLKNALKGLNEDVLKFRPLLEDAWTIKEHIVHVADAEVNAFQRFRLITAEEGFPISVVDENKWTKSFDFNDVTLEDYLELFSSLRTIAGNLLKKVPEDKWETLYVTHPKRGKFTLLDWVKIYSGHINFHIEYINRNIKLFNEKK